MIQRGMGVIGTVIAALCCLGTPVIVSIIASMGIGFLLTDSILVPILLLFLGWLGWTQRRAMAQHQHRGPLIGTAIATILMLVGIFVLPLLIVLGLLVVVGSQVWDLRLLSQWKSHATGKHAA